MESYKNLGGNSNVLGYEIGTDFIIVQFKDYSEYLYNYQSAGSGHIEQMKKLAVAGRGLNSYIMLNCKTKYAKKLK